MRIRCRIRGVGPPVRGNESNEGNEGNELVTRGGQIS
jgi:hypothetical protein